MTEGHDNEADITPLTRIADLLDAYPALEETLISIAPVFRKLRNPVLRRTVAKVATIEKAAAIAGLPVRALVVELRQAAGLEVPADPGDAAAESAALDEAPLPNWVDPARVRETIDADAMLDAGEVPLPHIVKQARALQAEELLLVTSAFRPAPLIAVLADAGFLCHIHAVDAGRFETYISRG